VTAGNNALGAKVQPELAVPIRAPGLTDCQFIKVTAQKPSRQIIECYEIHLPAWQAGAPSANNDQKSGCGCRGQPAKIARFLQE
jgi:hypothetical protein